MVRNRPLCTLCAVFLSIMAVCVWIVPESVRSSKGPAGPVEGNAAVTGTIVQKEAHKGALVYHLKLLELSGSGVGSFASGAGILVYDSNFTNMKTGQTIYARGQLKSMEQARNPGNFDAAGYYRGQGIEARMFAENCRVVKPCPRGIKGLGFQIREKLSGFRESWKELLLKSAGEKNGGILSAILLGDKSSLDEETKTLYQKCGIGHLIAISGLHVSFIGLGLYELLRKCKASCLGAGISGMVFLCFYMVMAGMSVSMVRAVIMLGLRMGAQITGRSCDSPTSLAVAGTVTVLWRPFCVGDAGFLFSYGAVLGILWLNGPLQTLLRGKAGKAFLGSLGVQIFLLPLTRWFYYEIPIYAVFLNLLVIPLLSLLMGAALLGSGLLGIGLSLPGGVCIAGAGGILKLYEVLCKGSLLLPKARIVTGKPWPWQVAACCFLLAAARQMLVKKKKVRAVFLLGAVLTLGTVRLRMPGNLKVVMADVGQGDGIYLEDPKGKHYLIDGGSSDVKEVGRYRLIPFLESQGAGTLDYVFLSHGDSDHINAVEEMLDCQETGIRIRNLVLPPGSEREEAFEVLQKKAGQTGTKVYTIAYQSAVKNGEMCITCLGPKETDGRDSNENSMILSLKYRKFSMLFTGDTERKGEEELVRTLTEEAQKGKATHYSVLKTAHHGSKSSTSEKLIRLITPTAALVSAGVDNSYGHPHPETLERLEDGGCSIYQTPLLGAVLLETDGEKLQIHGFLKDSQK